jgi:redox-sensitive bicupin YhaK (pirin superfamily)
MEDDPFPPEVRTLHEVDLHPGQSSPLLLRRDLLEVTLVLEGRLAIVDDLGSGEGRGKGSVHVANYGAGLALRRLNESMKNPVHFLRMCLPQRPRERRPLSVWSPLESDFYDNEGFQQVVLPTANDDDLRSPGPEAQMVISFGRIRPNLELTHTFPYGSTGYLVLVSGSAQVVTQGDEGPVDAGGACGFIDEPSFSIRTKSSKAQAMLLTFRAH